MKKAAGFITLHRQILDWEWYKHPHTAFLFIHLLLSANFVEGHYKGTTIKRGQLVRSVTGLSTETGLSIQTVKTALAHLRLTGEITDDTSRGFRVITVVKYDDFQKLTDKSTTNQPQINQQSNRQLTDNSSENQHLYNNINNINNDKKETIKQESTATARFTPPTKEQVFYFCVDNHLNLDVDRFYDYYSMQGWKLSNGNSMRDWQAAVRQWIARDIKKASQAPAPVFRPAKQVVAQQYTQRTDDPDAEAWARQLEELRRMQNG